MIARVGSDQEEQRGCKHVRDAGDALSLLRGKRQFQSDDRAAGTANAVRVRPMRTYLHAHGSAVRVSMRQLRGSQECLNIQRKDLTTEALRNTEEGPFFEWSAGPARLQLLQEFSNTTDVFLFTSQNH